MTCSFDVNCLFDVLNFLTVCLMCLICLQEEEFSDTLFGPSDYELQIREKILTSANLLNFINIFNAGENLLEVPSDTPDPLEKKAGENVWEQRTQAEP